MAYYCTNKGYLYENGESKEMIINNGTDIKIQGMGATKGSYKLVGKLTKDSDNVPLSVINTKDFSTKSGGTSITDNGIYIADVSGLYSVSVPSCSGFTAVYAKVGE